MSFVYWVEDVAIGIDTKNLEILASCEFSYEKTGHMIYNSTVTTSRDMGMKYM